MKRKLTIAILGLILSFSNVSGQKVREFGVDLGFNKTSSPNFSRTWNNRYSAPVFFKVGALCSWYNETHKFCFRKEVGINLQHAKIDLSGGGLGAGSSYNGHIYNLCLNSSLLAQIQISPSFSASVGPSAEILIIGANNIHNSNYSALPNLGSNSERQIKGVNRDYFNKPYYGVKIQVTQLLENRKTSIGLALTHFWTESNYSNFFLTNDTHASIYLSFGRTVKTIIE